MADIINKAPTIVVFIFTKFGVSVFLLHFPLMVTRGYRCCLNPYRFSQHSNGLFRGVGLAETSQEQRFISLIHFFLLSISENETLWPGSDSDSGPAATQ